MSKIQSSKIIDFEQIRATRQIDARQTGKAETLRAEDKQSIGGDKLQFSNRAAEVGKFLDQLKELPDVRTEKVNALREQISAGEYKPSGTKIADAILREEGNG